ncbi:hypothetical protein CRUP_036366 [Coryphaenoides rupestris]|nr:hypothetical protein CRUP_036366 [Coryphaenoides rupestris]
MKESIMNQEKLAKLQAQVRIGGKGSARRKKKVVHRTATADDKKLQFSLKKLGVNNISGIEEVNMFTNQGTVIHFNNPKVQASLAANTFTITGHAENKQLTEMLPGILNQLGADSLTSLRRLAETLPKPAGDKAPMLTVEEEEDDDVPVVVAQKHVDTPVTLTCDSATPEPVTWMFARPDGSVEKVELGDDFTQDGRSLNFQLSHSLTPYAEETSMMELTVEAMNDNYFHRTTKKFYLRDISEETRVSKSDFL